MGQNFESLVMQIMIRGEVFSGEAIFNSSTPGLSIEQSTGKIFCVKLLPDPAKFPILSGVGNGLRMIIDLETFDNGNIDLMADSLDILVTDSSDYSLTKLFGFSVGPGFSVDITIRPVLYTTTQEALDNFDYIERKCVDTDKDTGMDSLDGMKEGYSLSNCLVSATLTEIYKK